MIRRNIASGDLAFFATWCPKGTPMTKLVAVEGHRWAIDRRIAIKLAQRRIAIDRVLAWSLWRRAHQADARRAHLKRKMQL